MKGSCAVFTCIAFVLALSAFTAGAQDGGTANVDSLLSQLAPPAASNAAPAAAEAPAAPAPAPEAPKPEGSALSDLIGGLAPAAPAAPATPDAAAPATPAAPEAAAPDAAVPVPEVSRELIASMVNQERLRRQQMEEEGKDALAKAKQSMEKREFITASELFSQAIQKIPARPANDALLEEARKGRAEAAINLANSALRRDDLAEAEKQARMAKESDPTGHGPMSDKLADSIAKRKVEIEIENKKQAEEIEKLGGAQWVQSREEVEDVYRRARRMFEVENYDGAADLFEQVLLKDPYNKDAMRYLKKIEDRRLEASNVQRSATVADMMQNVRHAWNPPIKNIAATPVLPSGGSQISKIGASAALQEKMKKIVIPSIEFRQANIIDVITFLQETSIARDPEGIGVNILLKLEALPTTEEATPVPDFGADPLGNLGPIAPGAPAPMPDIGGLAPLTAEPAATTGGAGKIPPITMNLRNVNLLDALRYVTDIANLKYRIEDNAVIITPYDVGTGPIVTRMYPVNPSLIDTVITKTEATTRDRQGAGGGEFIGMGSAETTIEKADVKTFFINAGVKFPANASITYNPTISTLIVANTAENLEVLERILAALDIVPKQVEIEARFVEVAQNDLEALGFEWLLTDDWEIATKNGPGPVTSKERVVVNKNSGTGGFTRGLRFFDLTNTGIGPAASAGASTFLGSVLGVSSILTNPELSVVLHALSQRGNTDVLSAPRVTAKSGQNAQIRVVREIIYPTEFDTNVTRFGAGGFSGGTDQQFVTVVPQQFETREVGVILNCTPTVSPDGQTIDLTMLPEVSELVDWIQYGAETESYSYNIPQPIFASRNVSTSIVVWDGQTVVMGGLMREELTTVEDKVPLLGDIPLLGRLFRSNGSYSKKANLLIFVTARLVDPAGNPLKRSNVTEPPAPKPAG